jgi:glycerophosphoryl diester phosphodiesterase
MMFSCARGWIAVSLVAVLSAGSARSQMVVAHRGASHDAPENTLAAFRLAWQQGSDGIEGDFYLTADRHIVCIHDRDTGRTAGVEKPVEQSTLQQLRQLEYGSWKAPQWAGQTIPTFEDVYRTVPPGKVFVIELKSKQAIAPVLAAELKRLHTDDSVRLLIISFDQDTVRACRQWMPHVQAHWLTRLADGSDGPPPTAEQIARTVRRCGAAGVGMKGNRDLIDAAFIQRLARAGCPEFHVWTIDAIGDARYFQQLGAIGITTNRPAVIGAAIRSRRIPQLVPTPPTVPTSPAAQPTDAAIIPSGP